MKCIKCNNENIEFLSFMSEVEEGNLCWFKCVNCGKEFLGIEEDNANEN